MLKTIKGVMIDVAHEDVKAAKNFTEVMKIGMFDGLNDEDKKEAAKELLEELNKNKPEVKKDIKAD